MAIGSPWSRTVAALVVLATIPIGAKTSAGIHLAIVVAILAAMLALGSSGRPSRTMEASPGL